MNLLEYVQSLGSDISLEEKIFLTKNWKKKNEPTQEVAQEEKPNKFNEDGSLNVDSFSEETRGAAEKVNEKKKTAAAQDNATAPPVVSESLDSGDGSFQMNLQELMTCVQEKYPIKILLLDNNYLGMVRQWQEQFYDRNYSGVDLLNPDYIRQFLLHWY